MTAHKNAIMTAQTASAHLEIDLGAIRKNYKKLRDMAHGTCKLAGVIKADGYGLGMDKVCSALEEENCPLYFIATLDEGLALRKITSKPIAMLGGLYNRAEDEYIQNNITPVINSPEELQRWKKCADEYNSSLPFVLHADTGMSRLGFTFAEIENLAANPNDMNGLQPKIIMTHFASADDRTEEGSLDPMTIKQAQDFFTICDHFPSMARSLCNSAGLFCDPSFHLDLARPGMALYGLNPIPHENNPMSGVVSLKTRILQVRTAEKGDTAGYGATYRFDKKSILATVALGYADGFLRHLSNSGYLYYKNKACPIRGRVSMDTVIIDITDLEQKPTAGEWIDVIGKNQSADDLAADAGTIGYEILTSFGSRYQRLYR